MPPVTMPISPIVPTATSVGVRAVMRGNSRRASRPELRLRSELQRAGARFRKSYCVELQTRRVVIDIAFPARRLAVFVDGCFWHSCPQHGTQPRANAEYWTWKLARNRKRDQDVDTDLADSGWTVLRIWEHEDMGQVAARLARNLRHGRREAPSA